MKRSRIVVILELRHSDGLMLPAMRQDLIRAVKDVAMPHQKGTISVGVSFDSLPDDLPGDPR